MKTLNWKNATPEQELLWNYVYGIASALGSVAITPFVFQNTIAGSEFLTYNVNKLYFIIQADFGTDFTLRTSAASIRIYNEQNLISRKITNVTLVWNTTAAAVNYLHNIITIKNFYFSRIDQSSTYYDTMHLIGYRLNITP